jgi:hypothetical protein
MLAWLTDCGSALQLGALMTTVLNAAAEQDAGAEVRQTARVSTVLMRLAEVLLYPRAAAAGAAVGSAAACIPARSRPRFQGALLFTQLCTEQFMTVPLSLTSRSPQTELDSLVAKMKATEIRVGQLEERRKCASPLAPTPRCNAC